MRKLGTNFEGFLQYWKSGICSPVLTGLPLVDEFLRGLRGLVGLIGEPETCKSTLALQIGLYNALRGVPVYYVDAENGESLTEERALCHLNRKSWVSLSKMSEKVIKAAYAKLAQLPIYYTNECTFEDLKRDIDRLYTVANRGSMIVIVDSLQCLWSNAENIRLAIDEWLVYLDALKLSYDTKLVVIMTSEKSRVAYGRAVQGAGKESGRIEYKLSQQLDLRNEEDNIILTCTKNRYGLRGGNFRLYKEIENPKDPRTFTFTLTCGESLLDLEV